MLQATSALLVGLSEGTLRHRVRPLPFVVRINGRSNMRVTQALEEPVSQSLACFVDDTFISLLGIGHRGATWRAVCSTGTIWAVGCPRIKAIWTTARRGLVRESQWTTVGAASWCRHIRNDAPEYTQKSYSFLQKTTDSAVKTSRAPGQLEWIASLAVTPLA